MKTIFLRRLLILITCFFRGHDKEILEVVRGGFRYYAKCKRCGEPLGFPGLSKEYVRRRFPCPPRPRTIKGSGKPNEADFPIITQAPIKFIKRDVSLGKEFKEDLFLLAKDFDIPDQMIEGYITLIESDINSRSPIEPNEEELRYNIEIIAKFYGIPPEELHKGIEGIITVIPKTNKET